MFGRDSDRFACNTSRIPGSQDRRNISAKWPRPSSWTVSGTRTDPAIPTSTSSGTDLHSIQWRDPPETPPAAPRPHRRAPRPPPRRRGGPAAPAPPPSARGGGGVSGPFGPGRGGVSLPGENVVVSLRLFLRGEPPPARAQGQGRFLPVLAT